MFTHDEVLPLPLPFPLPLPLQHSALGGVDPNPTAFKGIPWQYL